MGEDSAACWLTFPFSDFRAKPSGPPHTRSLIMASLTPNSLGNRLLLSGLGPDSPGYAPLSSHLHPTPEAESHRSLSRQSKHPPPCDPARHGLHEAHSWSSRINCGLAGL